MDKDKYTYVLHHSRSPMMTDKPKEMRPYSVALEVMFKKKELKSKRRRLCLIALAILLAVLLIGGIAAVLIIFVGKEISLLIFYFYVFYKFYRNNGLSYMSRKNNVY